MLDLSALQKQKAPRVTNKEADAKSNGPQKKAAPAPTSFSYLADLSSLQGQKAPTVTIKKAAATASMTQGDLRF